MSAAAQVDEGSTETPQSEKKRQLNDLICSWGISATETTRILQGIVIDVFWEVGIDELDSRFRHLGGDRVTRIMIRRHPNILLRSQEFVDELRAIIAEHSIRYCRGGSFGLVASCGIRDIRARISHLKATEKDITVYALGCSHAQFREVYGIVGIAIRLK